MQSPNPPRRAWRLIRQKQRALNPRTRRSGHPSAFRLTRLRRAFEKDGLALPTRATVRADRSSARSAIPRHNRRSARPSSMRLVAVRVGRVCTLPPQASRSKPQASSPRKTPRSNVKTVLDDRLMKCIAIGCEVSFIGKLDEAIQIHLERLSFFRPAPRAHYGVRPAAGDSTRTLLGDDQVPPARVERGDRALDAELHLTGGGRGGSGQRIDGTMADHEQGATSRHSVCHPTHHLFD